MYAERAGATSKNLRQGAICSDIRAGRLGSRRHTCSTRCSRQGPDKEVRRPLGGAVCCLSRVSGLAHTLKLPPEWRCHKTINVGFLKRFMESATFPRTLPRRATTRGPAARSQDATEVLQTRTTTRRGRTRQEFLVKWPGERQAQWISLEQLRTSLPHDERLSILGPEGS